MVDRDRCRPQAISRAGPSEEPGASAVSHRDRQPLEWWTIQRQPLPFLHAGASNPTTARGGVLCLAGPSVWWIRPPWDCCSVAPIADLHEQTFVAHAGQIAAGSANVGQLFRPGYPILKASAIARSLREGFRPQASRIRSARSRSRLRISMEGFGVVSRGIGNTKFAVSVSPRRQRFQ
jgi:hypothetical protein